MTPIAPVDSARLTVLTPAGRVSVTTYPHTSSGEQYIGSEDVAMSIVAWLSISIMHCELGQADAGIVMVTVLFESGCKFSVCVDVYCFTGGTSAMKPPLVLNAL